MSISYEARALLTYIAGQRKGRVGYDLGHFDRAHLFARDLIANGYIKERRLGFEYGFQITEAGKAYLGGEA